jgi:DNA-binding NarL/FixJ family response regulator
MEEKIKIMVVDDHEIFRNGLIMIINKLKYAKVVAEASNGNDFLDKLPEALPDIVFMDIEMPGMNGIEATRLAREKFPDLKIIALSMFGEDEYLQHMIDAGVCGFLLKNINRDGLDRAIRCVIEGKNYYSEELMAIFARKYVEQDKKVENDADLTKRELEVLQLIAEGLTDQEIADKLFLSMRTVNWHRANLIAKTGSKNTVNLITYAIKNKLVNI